MKNSKLKKWEVVYQSLKYKVPHKTIRQGYTEHGVIHHLLCGKKFDYPCEVLSIKEIKDYEPETKIK